jgi:TatD DNase family protein
MKIPHIDTHAHLSMLERRGIDPHAVLTGLFAEGFGFILDISLDPGDLAKRIGDFSVYPRIRFASGLWPHAGTILKRHDLIGELERDINNAQAGLVCALGEFGLDHYWNGEGRGKAAGAGEGSSDLAGERELMEMQMDLAKKLSLPVIIHSRDAPKETAEILKAYPESRGVIHCFSYGPEELKTFLDLGYFISFAGNLTYKNAQNIRDACALVPPDRLLLETDCPYLAPVPHRGKPAHPGMVAETCKAAAEIRRVDPAALAEQTAENTRALFGVEF